MRKREGDELTTYEIGLLVVAIGLAAFLLCLIHDIKYLGLVPR